MTIIEVVIGIIIAIGAYSTYKYYETENCTDTWEDNQ